MLLEKPGRLCYEFDLDYYQKITSKYYLDN